MTEPTRELRIYVTASDPRATDAIFQAAREALADVDGVTAIPDAPAPSRQLTGTEVLIPFAISVAANVVTRVVEEVLKARLGRKQSSVTSVVVRDPTAGGESGNDGGPAAV